MIESYCFNAKLDNCVLQELRQTIFIDKNAIKPTLGFFVANIGNFENVWEDLWEFHDFGWEFLYFGSNHTAQLSRGNVDRI